MPIVLITRNSENISDDTLRGLVKYLPFKIADALHVESVSDAHLTTDDIEIKVNERGRFDTWHHDIEVIVQASYFPERAANLPERTGHISAYVRGFLEIYGCSGFVYVRLAPAAFDEWY